MEAIKVEVCLDSHLVVNQFRGDFRVKDLRMSEYLKLVRLMQIVDTAFCTPYDLGPRSPMMLKL